jgi:hypothetical protein
MPHFSDRQLLIRDLSEALVIEDSICDMEKEDYIKMLVILGMDPVDAYLVANDIPGVDRNTDLEVEAMLCSGMRLWYCW